MKFRILFFFICMSPFIHAQTISQAKALYLKGEYRKALPVFKNQLKLKPKDASINFWYGVCLLETKNTKAALPYLNFAKNRHISDANRYLAKYYMDVMAPDSALVCLNEYLENIKLDPKKKQAALLLKDSIESDMEQFQKVEDICFIDSIIVPKSAMFSAVKLSPEAGNLKSANAAFPKEPKASGSAYFPERNDRVYFSKSVPNKGLDIFARHLILNEWGKDEPLPDIINSEADECNPFFLSDGITLYFASNGHGSMGGYDLFVTRFDKATGTYLQPDHLNKPFNSKGNDYFLLIDEFRHRGYLATDRNQKDGYVAIYTFIPNDTVTMLHGKNNKELEDFAQIRSIKATWEGKNVDSLMHKSAVASHPILPVKGNESNDSGFAFIINDSLTYNKPADFKSDEAKQGYINYRSRYKKYLLQKKTLEDKRLQYEQATPESQKQISAELLGMEKEVLTAEQELPVLEKKIRNLEITELSK